MISRNTIGAQAPSTKVELLDKDNNIIVTELRDDLVLSYGVLIFYPGDFTFVCPTELHAIQRQHKQFVDRNVKVYGISPDSVHVHKAWKAATPEQGGLGPIDFSLISDPFHHLSNVYNSLVNGKVLRTTVIIDREFRLQHISHNGLGVGRNVDEILRLIDAIQLVESGSQVCPANWTKGTEAMDPTIEGVFEHRVRKAHEDNPELPIDFVRDILVAMAEKTVDNEGGKQ